MSRGPGPRTAIRSTFSSCSTSRSSPAASCERGSLGVLEAQQRENGKAERNDRLIAVACDSRDHKNVKRMKDLDKHLRKEIEHFFVSYHELTGTPFEILGYRGGKVAERLLRRAKST